MVRGSAAPSRDGAVQIESKTGDVQAGAAREVPADIPADIRVDNQKAIPVDIRVQRIMGERVAEASRCGTT